MEHTIWIEIARLRFRAARVIRGTGPHAAVFRSENYTVVSLHETPAAALAEKNANVGTYHKLEKPAPRFVRKPHWFKEPGA